MSRAPLWVWPVDCPIFLYVYSVCSERGPVSGQAEPLGYSWGQHRNHANQRARGVCRRRHRRTGKHHGGVREWWQTGLLASSSILTGRVHRKLFPVLSSRLRSQWMKSDERKKYPFIFRSPHRHNFHWIIKNDQESHIWPILLSQAMSITFEKSTLITWFGIIFTFYFLNWNYSVWSTITMSTLLDNICPSFKSTALSASLSKCFIRFIEWQLIFYCKIVLFFLTAKSAGIKAKIRIQMITLKCALATWEGGKRQHWASVISERTDSSFHHTSCHLFTYFFFTPFVIYILSFYYGWKSYPSLNCNHQSGKKKYKFI